MCEVADRIRQQGIRQGVRQGIQQGEDKLGKLIEMLIEAGRIEDVRLASVDEACRTRLYSEMGIGD